MIWGVFSIIAQFTWEVTVKPTFEGVCCSDYAL
jgi:hypothetical protein